MNAYIDSSAILAIALGQDGHQDVARRLDEYADLIASNLVEAEIRSTLERERRPFDQSLTANFTWIYPNRPLTDEFELVLSAGYLRGADLWHVAVALFASPDPSQIAFITLDVRQREVAQNIGFQT